MDDKAIAQMIADFITEEETLLSRLTKVRAARATLEALQTEDPVEFDGNLADACRTILQSNTAKSWSPTEIRDELQGVGYTKKHDNLLAAIHGVLKRIVESGDARTKERKDGSTRYYWVRPVNPPTRPNTARREILSIEPLISQNAALQILNSTDSMRQIFERLSTSAAEFDRIAGAGKFKELEEQLTKSTKALEQSGLLPLLTKK
jgi:ketosteroid isomerase-like protein